MAAKCVNCHEPIIWIAEFLRYRHRHTGSAFCGSSRMKAAVR